MTRTSDNAGGANGRFVLRVRQTWAHDAFGNRIDCRQDRIAGRFEARRAAENEADLLTNLAWRYGRQGDWQCWIEESTP
jgi:hypothetical protein